MNGVTIDAVVEAASWDVLPALETLADRAVAAALTRVRPALAPQAEVSLLFCDDAAIRRLNAEWRGLDKPTNVLSFPVPGDLAARPLLGDIAIAYETTARESHEEGKALADHVTHLVVHGFLHLLGYDHEDEDEAEAMEAAETAILADLGIADPYGDALPRQPEAALP